MKETLFLLLILSVGLQNASAEEKTQFHAVGFGLSSCGEYINSPKNGMRRGMMLQWAYGFLSAKSETAHNLYVTEEKGYLDNMDADAIEVYIELHCSKNPLDNLYAAVNQLDYDLFQRNKK